MLMTAFPPIDLLDDAKPDYGEMSIDQFEDNLAKVLAIMDEHLRHASGVSASRLRRTRSSISSSAVKERRFLIYLRRAPSTSSPSDLCLSREEFWLCCVCDCDGAVMVDGGPASYYTSTWYQCRRLLVVSGDWP